MRKNIRLLEDRVSQAAERLQRLSEERRTLVEETRSLRDRLEALEQRPPAASSSDTDGQAERAEIIDVLRQVVTELRGSG